MYVLFGLLPEVCMNVLIQMSIPNEKDFHVTHVNGFILLYLLTIIVKTSKWSQVDCRTDHPPAKR